MITSSVDKAALIVSNDPARYAGLRIPVIPDVIPGAGALGGLLCAVDAKRCATAIRARRDRGELIVTGLFGDVQVRELGPEALAPYDEGSLFENVNTPHDHARARGWVELNEKPSEDRITE
jgi:molybdopterin-guanine dinucleotide biosynthesis protein A